MCVCVEHITCIATPFYLFSYSDSVFGGALSVAMFFYNHGEVSTTYYVGFHIENFSRGRNFVNFELPQ